MVDPDAHDRLSMMADFHDSNINEHAAKLLESAIEYEWRNFNVLLEKAERTAKRRKALESVGIGRNAAEVLRQRAEQDE